MNLIIRGKTVVVGASVLLIVLAVLIPCSVSVFKCGTRNLPIYSVERDDNKIALTFNCAWGADDIESVLESLKLYNAKATFFVVGQWAEKYPDKLKLILEHGHEIGGHSYSHKDYTHLSKEQIFEDIALNAKAVKDACGAEIKYIRVPSGSYNNNAIEAVEEAGYVAIQWSVDTIDYSDTTVEEIRKRACGKTKSGDILLMHTGTKNTASALPYILGDLSGKYSFCPISELVYEIGFDMKYDGKIHKTE